MMPAANAPPRRWANASVGAAIAVMPMVAAAARAKRVFFMIVSWEGGSAHPGRPLCRIGYPYPHAGSSENKHREID